MEEIVKYNNTTENSLTWGGLQAVQHWLFRNTGLPLVLSIFGCGEKLIWKHYLRFREQSFTENIQTKNELI